MKTLITTALAATMMATVSHAAIISNGGKPDITLTEIQQKLDAGEFQHYPGVVRLTATGTRYTAAGNNYLFKKTFKPGMALPKVVDMVALQRAVANSDVILVASRDLILPTPTIFVEIGRQNGVDPIAFMQHYIEATTDIDSDAFGIHAKAQTMAALQTLGLQPQGITVDVEALIAAGISELEAERLAHLATQVALQEAVRTVEQLTESESRLAATLTAINAELTTIQNAWMMPEATAPEQLRAINAEMVRLNGLVRRNATLAAEFRRIAEERGIRIDELTAERNDAIEQRNLIGVERDNAVRAAIEQRDAAILLQTRVDGLSAEVSNLTSQLNAAHDLAIAEYTRGYNAGLAENNDEAYNRGRAVGVTAGRGLERGVMGVVAYQLTGESQHNRTTREMAAAIYEAGRAAGVAAEVARVAALPTTSEITTSATTNTAGITTFTNGDHTHRYNAGSLANTYVAAENPALAAYMAAYGMVGQRMTGAMFAEVHAQISIAVDEAFKAGYNAGYEDGYNDGYADGFADGVASTQ